MPKCQGKLLLGEAEVPAALAWRMLRRLDRQIAGLCVTLRHVPLASACRGPGARARRGRRRSALDMGPQNCKKRGGLCLGPWPSSPLGLPRAARHHPLHLHVFTTAVCSFPLLSALCFQEAKKSRGVRILTCLSQLSMVHGQLTQMVTMHGMQPQGHQREGRPSRVLKKSGTGHDVIDLKLLRGCAAARLRGCAWSSPAAFLLFGFAVGFRLHDLEIRGLKLASSWLGAVETGASSAQDAPKG